MDTIFGSYAYVNGGMVGPLTPIGSYSGLFTGPGAVGYTQAGFTQLAPVPEPSSLTLLASSIPSVLGYVWLRRRKAAGNQGRQRLGRSSRRCESPEADDAVPPCEQSAT